jgi:hypothetical protein
VTERRDLGEEPWLDVLPCDEELDGLDPGNSRGVDEIVGLDGEEPGVSSVLSRGEELPDEPELLVVPRRDQAACEPGSASSAAFARSATAANACGSLTAMSASDLRSSVIPARFTPSMNRL